MFGQSLDLSLIAPQPTDYKTKRNQLENDTSLEEILDELQEASPKKSSTPFIEIQKGCTVMIKPTQKIPSLLLAADPVFPSADQLKPTRQVQFTRRDHKGLTSPVSQSAVKSSLEMIYNGAESETRATHMLSSQISGSESHDVKSTSTQIRGSNLLGSDMKIDPVNFRRLSSPNVFGLIQSPARLIGSTNPLAKMMPNAPNSYTGPRFNVAIPESPITSPDAILNKRELPGNQFTNSPQSSRSLEKPKSIPLKLDSPHLGPVNGDYLAKVLQKNGGSSRGSTAASTTESPKSAELEEKNEFRLVKRGSFSVFRKIAEAELVKNT